MLNVRNSQSVSRRLMQVTTRLANFANRFSSSNWIPSYVEVIQIEK